MDLKSFYKKIDVDSIKNRLPPLPQIKIPKLKSRKIFKSSREDLSHPQGPAMAMGGAPPMSPQFLQPCSTFIDRTPTRISTVSSLMNISYGCGEKNDSGLSTYRTANSFEAENCPSKPPENEDTSSGRTINKLTERIQDRCRKTYKDISEFKIKNIFAKKTVVKRTEIEVDIYAKQYEMELREEQELEMELERQEEDYAFRFKEPRRQNSQSSGSISPAESTASGVPSPLRPRLQELQRNITPPMLVKRRKAVVTADSMRTQVPRSISDESPNLPPPKPNRSSLWSVPKGDSVEETGPYRTTMYTGVSKLGEGKKTNKDNDTPSRETPQVERGWKFKSIRDRFNSNEPGTENKSKKVSHAQDSSVKDSPNQEKKSWRLSNLSLRHAESLEKTNHSSPEGKFTAIKQSIKRMKERNLKREASVDSSAEPPDEPQKSKIPDQLKAGLRRLRLKERSFSFDEGSAPEKDQENVTQSATNRLRNFKKSLKAKRPPEPTTDDETPEKPAPPGRSMTLIRKLNHIRSRKAESENDEEGTEATQSDGQQKTKSSNLEKLDQARNKALKKMNAQMQKMKMFQGKSRDSPAESSPEKATNKSVSNDSKAGIVAEISKTTKTMWTTNKSMSESLESDDSIDAPRVLIHQDNSDQYESTLIIAVTRPAPPIPSPVISEIIPRAKPKPMSEWIPNKNAVSSFLEISPTPPHLDIIRGHVRKQSMDSNDSDSWIPENFRIKSCASSTSTGLNKITEGDEPWKVHSVFSEDKLYKTRSIDIFTHRNGGAFSDFEEELKNVPVRRVTAISGDSINKTLGDSTDDDDDYDNASRITRLQGTSPNIPKTTTVEIVRNDSMTVEEDNANPSPEVLLSTKKGQIGNSQESLDANYDEDEVLSSDEEEDDLPNMAPSPPPSYSPPPPPLPSRKPPRHIPDRNDSMVRLARPLIKQTSMRHSFDEEIESNDLGKVNKLISRFEKSPPPKSIPQIQLTAYERDDEDDEKKPAIKAEEEALPKNGNKKRPAPIPRKVAPRPGEGSNNNNNNNNIEDIPQLRNVPDVISPANTLSFQMERQYLANMSSRSPTSEYGSPIGSLCLSEKVSTSSEYGSPTGSLYFNKAVHSGRRLSTRSSLRDDDTFYSFESDEENNFYSLTESTSAKYSVEI